MSQRVKNYQTTGCTMIICCSLMRTADEMQRSKNTSLGNSGCKHVLGGHALHGLPEFVVVSTKWCQPAQNVMYVLVYVRMSNVVFPCLRRSIPQYRHEAKNRSRMPILRPSSLTVERTGWHPVIRRWTLYVFIAQTTELAEDPQARLQQARCAKTVFIPYSCNILRPLLCVMMLLLFQ